MDRNRSSEQLVEFPVRDNPFTAQFRGVHSYMFVMYNLKPWTALTESMKASEPNQKILTTIEEFGIA
jgi:hypothetical protein